MSLWKRLKNLWKLSATEFYYSVPNDLKKINKIKIGKDYFKDFEYNVVIPLKPATIVEDELPDVFDNQEENGENTK